MGIRSITVYTCPVCGAKIDRSAVATRADMDDPIWGEPGERFLICREGAHYHIEIREFTETLSGYIYVIPYSLPKRIDHETL